MSSSREWRPEEGSWCLYESEAPLDEEIAQREYPFVHPESCYQQNLDTYFAVIETHLKIINEQPDEETAEFRLLEGVLVRSNRVHVLVTRLQECGAGLDICRDDWKSDLEQIYYSERLVNQIMSYAMFNNFSHPTPLASAVLLREVAKSL